MAVLLLNHVDYRTGVLRDIAAITRRAHDAGAIVIWDLCHSAGALPIELDADDVDFAVGCTYKYLNGGPGAPSFIYAAQRHHDRIVQPLSGWWTHAQPFAMENRHRPASGIRRLLCGTQPILSLRALKAALDLFDDVDLAVVRAKSLALTGLFMDLVEPVCRESGARIITPRNEKERGSHVSVAFGHGFEVAQAMIARGIIGDFRAPDIMRSGSRRCISAIAMCSDAAAARRHLCERPPGAIRNTPSVQRDMMGRVVVCGSLNMDVIVQSDRRPAAGETILGATVSLLPGGKGSNQAIASARLGAATAMLGCVGADAFGRELIAVLARNSVDKTGVKVRPGASTGVALIQVSDGDNAITGAGGANDTFAAAMVRRAPRRDETWVFH